MCMWTPFWAFAYFVYSISSIFFFYVPADVSYKYAYLLYCFLFRLLATVWFHIEYLFDFLLVGGLFEIVDMKGVGYLSTNRFLTFAISGLLQFSKTCCTFSLVLHVIVSMGKQHCVRTAGLVDRRVWPCMMPPSWSLPIGYGYADVWPPFTGPCLFSVPKIAQNVFVL